jgi:hypothetical protein
LLLLLVLSLFRDFGSGPSEAYQLDEEGTMEAGGGALNFSVLPAGFFAGTGDSHFSAADIEVFALSAEQVMAISMARAGGLEAGPDKPNYRAPPLNNLVNLLSSKILTDNTYAAPLGRFFAGNTKCPSRLLYRATRDGFKPNDWQEKCVNQGPTLTIVKAKSGNIFGQFSMIKSDSLRCSVCCVLFAHHVVFLVVFSWFVCVRVRQVVTPLRTGPPPCPRSMVVVVEANGPRSAIPRASRSSFPWSTSTSTPTPRPPARADPCASASSTPTKRRAFARIGDRCSDLETRETFSSECRRTRSTTMKDVGQFSSFFFSGNTRIQCLSLSLRWRLLPFLAWLLCFSFQGLRCQ